MISLFVKLVQKYLYPRPDKCCLCQNQAVRHYFCQNCWQELSRAQKQEFCRKCGRILAHSTSLYCPECTGSSCEFSFARAVGEYGGIYREILHQYKYVGRQSLARPMGLMMADLVLSDKRYRGIERIVPIPLAPAKYAQRRFNQSQLLAEEIGEILKLPVDTKLLLRVRDTRIQAKLSKKERGTNLAGAFQVSERFAEYIMGRRFLVVDDVFTTGTTTAEAAKTLRAAGAGGVAVVTWATGLVRPAIQERGNADEPKKLF